MGISKYKVDGNKKVNLYANNRAQVIKKQLPIIDNCNYDLQTGFRQLN